jgi:hypothetical protein
MLAVAAIGNMYCRKYVNSSSNFNVHCRKFETVKNIVDIYLN